MKKEIGLGLGGKVRCSVSDILHFRCQLDTLWKSLICRQIILEFREEVLLEIKKTENCLCMQHIKAMKFNDF